ncbi:MAG: hypothetical protein ACTSXH_19595 [Promethearchaeota archaeon]
MILTCIENNIVIESDWKEEKKIPTKKNIKMFKMNKVNVGKCSLLIYMDRATKQLRITEAPLPKTMIKAIRFMK